METLKKALLKREIDCRVETPAFVYCGLARDLLKEIPEGELTLLVKWNCHNKKQLTTKSSEISTKILSYWRNSDE